MNEANLDAIVSRVLKAAIETHADNTRQYEHAYITDNIAWLDQLEPRLRKIILAELGDPT